MTTSDRIVAILREEISADAMNSMGWTDMDIVGLANRIADAASVSVSEEQLHADMAARLSRGVMTQADAVADQTGRRTIGGYQPKGSAAAPATVLGQPSSIQPPRD